MISKFTKTLFQSSILTRIKQMLKLGKGSNFFPGSQQYWVERYKSGRNSGCGSYGHLAEFKAEVINRFVLDNKIESVIEFGCGDGNQLLLANYPNYTGYDISPEAIQKCSKLFSNDPSKSFRLYDEIRSDELSDLTLSLDVIYHLTEDEVFSDYMKVLFKTSRKFVIIYSSNSEEQHPQPHVRQRKFTNWIEKNQPSWQLLTFIPNKYPYNGNFEESSFSDFYIYMKR